jgi:3-deoxy-D-manno-octulosonic-acid transferase
MFVLYTFGITLYSLLIRLAAPFNPKAREWVAGRKGWKNKLSNAFQDTDKIVWFHAASLGEFEQGRPVMEASRRAFPNHKILLTFFSPSGYEQMKDYVGADVVMYLPADCPRNAKYFVRTLKPAMAVFIKYEFWYNYLSELNRSKTPVIFISALFRNGQPFFKWYGGWFRKKLRNINHFFVQDESSSDKLKSIGIDQITVSGDTRFDRVADILASKRGNADIEKFCKGHNVLLAGSTWPPDEEMLSALPARFPELKIIIAPHEIKEERIRQLAATMKLDVARFTRDKPASWPDKQVLILDTIGILSSVYRYADIAYIGGAFATGLHNIQEPAVNGMPVIFGPKYDKFREAVALVHDGGAYSINSSSELLELLDDLLYDTVTYNAACEVSKKYMLEQTGATEKILSGIRTYL